MKKHEMTAREFITQRRRMCNAYWVVNDWSDLSNMHESCGKCPLDDFCDGAIDNIDEEIAVVAKWAAEHPEETLEPVGDGIYFDPQHKIVPDEITRVYTLEVTFVDKDGCVLDEEQRQRRIDDMFPNADDAKCVKMQQFVTKSHEEQRHEDQT